MANKTPMRIYINRCFLVVCFIICWKMRACDEGRRRIGQDGMKKSGNCCKIHTASGMIGILIFLIRITGCGNRMDKVFAAIKE